MLPNNQLKDNYLTKNEQNNSNNQKWISDQALKLKDKT